MFALASRQRRRASHHRPVDGGVAARGGFPMCKRSKRKRRSWATRWKPTEAAKLKQFERPRQYGWRDNCA